MPLPPACLEAISLPPAHMPAEAPVHRCASLYEGNDDLYHIHHAMAPAEAPATPLVPPVPPPPAAAATTGMAPDELSVARPPHPAAAAEAASAAAVSCGLPQAATAAATAALPAQHRQPPPLAGSMPRALQHPHPHSLVYWQHLARALGAMTASDPQRPVGAAAWGRGRVPKSLQSLWWVKTCR